MKRHFLITLLSFLLFLAACSTQATPEKTTSLTLTITGLPKDVQANVQVSGPNKFSTKLNASETLSDLEEGAYLVSVQSIETNGELYLPILPVRNVIVDANQTSEVSISYVKPKPLNLQLGSHNNGSGTPRLSLSAEFQTEVTRFAVQVRDPDGQLIIDETFDFEMPLSGYFDTFDIPLELGNYAVTATLDGKTFTHTIPVTSVSLAQPQKPTILESSPDYLRLEWPALEGANDYSISVRKPGDSYLNTLRFSSAEPRALFQGLEAGQTYEVFFMAQSTVTDWSKAAQHINTSSIPRFQITVDGN